MSEAHARLGPSNHRWPHCPGSVREEARYPDIAGEAAIDGTSSHLLLEMCLLNGVRADSYIGQIIGVNHEDMPTGWVVHQDRVDRVQMCLDYVSRRYAELKSEYPDCQIKIMAEAKASPGSMYGRTDWWGTVDITIMVVNESVIEFVEIADYKDGRGWVSEKDNTQLFSYMLGQVAPYISSKGQIKWADRVKKCRTTIVQPRTSPPVRYDEPEFSYVLDRGSELAKAAEATDDPDAPLIPDNKGGKGYCQWCKHKSNCSALAEAPLESIKTMTDITTTGDDLFSSLQKSVIDVESIPNDELSKLMDVEARVQAMFDKIKAEAQKRVEQGQTVKGYAMKPGRKSRVWNESADEIAKKLKNKRLKKSQIYPETLVTPAAVMKDSSIPQEVRDKIEKDLIAEKAGAMKLTKVGEERQKPSAESMFSNVPEAKTKSLFENVDNGSADVKQSTPLSFI